MPDYGERHEGNGNDYNDCSSSPPPKSSKHGGSDDHSDSKSQHGLRDSERESSKSNEQNREKGREREKERDRDKDREHEGDHGRHHRDHQKSRSDRKERGISRDDEDDYHRRDYERRRDYDKERDGRHRNKSRSRSRGRSDHRSRSRSRSQSKSKHASSFDMAPASALLTGVAAATATADQLTGSISNMFPLIPGQPFGALPVMPVQGMNQQATRHARRVYVGGLPPTANEQSVATFFSRVMSAIGGNTAGPGDAVVDVYINHEKKFAFVEMRSVEEASNAMALAGVIFEGAPVKVKRPSDYNPSLAAALGPNQPSPSLNLAAVGLTPGSTAGLEGPDRIFVGGLPYSFTEAQIRELLEYFGPLRSFDLVKDRETGNSKGYAFCVYQDLSATDIACAALNGIKVGDRTLTVRRANQGVSQPKPEHETVLIKAKQQRLLFPGGAGALPTKVVCLTQVVSADELRDDDEYEDIVEDMRGEGRKFGKLAKVVIPRPSPIGEPSPGVGKVFLEYADPDGAEKAIAGLNGRKFDGRQVVAICYPENKFSQGEYAAG